MRFKLFGQAFLSLGGLVRLGLRPANSSRLGFVLVFLAAMAGCAAGPSPQRARLWELNELSMAPVAEWGATNGMVQELYYAGEPLNGKPTRVFAYLGRPADALDARHPAMVLVHGGGGKAFKEWAEHWAKRGYVALAMDLSGNGPTGHLADGGPDQSDQTKFRNFTESEARDMWSYHAVAAVVRGHSLLRSLPEVDPDRVGLTGISWGGYLTCIVAGIDPRFKVAVPVYGCGFLGDNSVWKDKALAEMAPEARVRWLQLFDPRQYLGSVRCPMLFLNGTTDFAYPLDSYQKSYRLVPARWRHLSVVVNLPHGHIWTFREVDVFVDSVLRETPPLARFEAPFATGEIMSANLDRRIPIKDAQLCYTTNTGPWQKRVWLTAPAQSDGRRISAELPATLPLAAFLAVTDERGLRISSEHIEWPGH
jgi:dienelactone hydrolase